MFTKIKNVRVVGIAAAVSNVWESIRDVSNESESLILKFKKMTGVEGRYAANLKQTTSDFCFAAANRLLEEKHINRTQIGILVFVTQTSDYDIPATACVLQNRLGLGKDCLAFDVNLGCSGFTYGVTIAGSLLNTTNTKYALLLAGDTSAKEKSNKRRVKTTHAASMLFGDSGTATLLEKVEDGSLLLVSSKTDGAGYKTIISPYQGWRHPDVPDRELRGTRMDDIAVFEFATEEAAGQINEYMKETDTTPANYDCLVLHQANMMIMKRIAKKTGFPNEKNLVSINHFGNTSSSSIPISLVNEYGNNENNKTIKALCCGFGVGLSWSTVALDINICDILPLVHTEDYFDDGYPDE